MAEEITVTWSLPLTIEKDHGDDEWRAHSPYLNTGGVGATKREALRDLLLANSVNSNENEMASAGFFFDEDGFLGSTSVNEVVDSLLPEPPFKVGDKVRDKEPGLLLEGTVLRLEEENYLTIRMVRHKNPQASAEVIRRSDEVELVPEELTTEPPFKVGDKVRDKGAGRLLEGTVLQVFTNRNLFVRIDKHNDPMVVGVEVFRSYNDVELVPEELTPEPKFKVGDKVRDKDAGLLIEGTVVEVYKNGHLSVQADRHRNQNVPNNVHRNFDEVEMVPEPPTPEPKFKVGDKVRDKDGYFLLEGEILTLYGEYLCIQVNKHNTVGSYPYTVLRHIDAVELVPEEPTPEPKFRVGDKVQAPESPTLVGTIEHQWWDTIDKTHRYQIRCETHAHPDWVGRVAPRRESQLELVKEEPPAPKPEPTLKVGDWAVCIECGALGRLETVNDWGGLDSVEFRWTFFHSEDFHEENYLRKLSPDWYARLAS